MSCLHVLLVKQMLVVVMIFFFVYILDHFSSPDLFKACCTAFYDLYVLDLIRVPFLKRNSSPFPLSLSIFLFRLIEAMDVVFECGPNCGCGPECVNRTSQRGLKYKLEVI